MNLLTKSLPSLLLTLCAASAALADCAAPQVIVPTGRVTADTRPAIRWSAIEGATGYALKVQSRVPEGPLVVSFDVVVSDTQFLPPAALAAERAKVSVSVAARCDGRVSATASGWFLIDAAALCPAPSALRITREQGLTVANWGATSGATVYEVRLHSPMDGQVLKALETREPRARFDGDLPHGTVVSVRPHCVRGLGEAALGTIAH